MTRGSVIAASRVRRADRGAAPSLVRRVLRQTHTRVGLALTVPVLLIAFFGPFAAPHDPNALLSTAYDTPSHALRLGTDYLGRDVLSRVLWGGRSVVWMAVASAAIGMLAGVIIGMVAGYASAYVDEALMRAMDVLLAFPQIVLVLLFVSLIGPKPWLIVLVVGMAWTPEVARVTRGLTLEVKHREYVEFAEALGVARRRILSREILPNLMTPLMVESGLRLTWSIAVIAAISFLGFGIQPPNSDWGLMINENRAGLTTQPWPVIVPALLIGVFAVGTNLVTEGVARTIAGVDRSGKRK